MKIYNKGNRVYRRVFKNTKGHYVHHLSGKTLDYPKDVGERMLKNHAKELERVDGGEKNPKAKMADPLNKSIKADEGQKPSPDPEGTDGQDNA